MEEEDLKTFIDALLDPAPLESLYGAPFTSGTVIIDVYRRPDQEPEQVPLVNIFPFMTVFDLKLGIYHHYLEKGDDTAHPDFVFIGFSKFGEGKNLETINYNWSFSATPNKSVYLHDPIDLASQAIDIDVRFVEENGSRKNIRRTDTERVTVENKFPRRIPKIRAYFYRALEALIPGERPLSELEWNGRLYPYFPTLSIGKDELTEDQIQQGKKMVNNFVLRSKLFQKIERDFVKVERPLPPLKLSAVHYLRLNYTKPAAFPGVEIVFYETPVNSHRPYMRLMPVENSPISKIHMFEDSDEPNLEDPNSLYFWSQEKNPTPERDYVMMKILVRRRGVNTFPLYSTIRLFDDGTADVTIEPPRPLKKLTPMEDLSTLGERLTEGLAGLNYLGGIPKLKNGNVSFSMNTQGYSNVPNTVAEFRGKLPIMSAIFQEIPSVEKERTFITLRYKLVSNYSREDSIQNFITQLLTILSLEGEQDPKEIISKIKKEFQISTNEAREQYAKNLEKTSDFILTNPDSKDYNSFQDAGVDISVYQFSKIFFFRIHRADSYETIQRICTFLGILFGAPAEELKVEEKEMKMFKEGDKVLTVRADRSVEREEEAEFEDDFKSVEDEGVAEGAATEEEAAPEEVQEKADNFEGEIPDYLDLMGDEERDGPTLEEIEEEVKTTTAITTAITKPVPVKATVPPVPTAIPASKAAAIKGVETYFSEKLKEADRSLFDFHKTNPDLKKYVTQCASNLTRQPAVLSFEQLELMKDEYAEELSENIMKFYVFPLDKDPKKDAYDPPKEYYTVMRYGSSPTNQNYYLCSQFFCIRDEMLVRKVELEGTKLRPKHYVKLADGSLRTTKAANTCPMCEGELIVNRRFPGVNHTVIERTVKAGTENGRHLFIRFLKKTNHPDGHFLPCCFLEDQPLRFGDPQFPEPTQEVFERRREPAIRDTEEEEEEEHKLLAEDKKSPMPYQTTMLMAKTASIVGVEKMPLDPEIKKVKKLRRGKSGAYEESEKVTEYVSPQIGLLPTKLNEYFSQNPIDIVSRTFNPQKLKPKSKGFLRIGVENRGIARNDSFLAAVAPFFYCNSAEELKEVLGDRIQPRLFMGLNFGNLLLEFYDPMWVPKKGFPKLGVLQEWARDALKMPKNSVINNQELVKRAYRSYDKFRNWLFGSDSIKEYRHFAHFFSLPGIMRTGIQTDPETPVREYYRPGIIFIVLEILSSGEMKVHCPPYPISEEMYMKSDIGFILKHFSGVWEPIFHYNNDANPDDLVNKAMLTFSTGKKTIWPEIVKQRFDEFRTQCSVKQGQIGIYTSNFQLKSNKVLPINVVRTALSKHSEINLHGLLRDSYNHVAALVYEGSSGGLIAVPVIEDGMSYSSHTDIHGKSKLFMLILDVKIIIDWNDYEPGSIGQVVDFYRQYLEPEFPEVYTVKRYVKRKKPQELVAIQLESGLYIPVAPLKKFSQMPRFPDEPREVEEMEWEINRKIVIDKNVSEDEVSKLSQIKMKEMEEAFQHLRITFSNWLNSKPEGGEFRDTLQEILANKGMPLYEKRKRVEILIGPLMEFWVMEKDEDAEFKPSILRVDCTVRSEEECKGSCSWSSEKGKCLIHASPNESAVPGARILLSRLIEELIRFTNKRREMFTKQVSRIAILDDPVREGDQYIIPEKSAAWTELLRTEWSVTSPESPQYLEEMRQPPKQTPLAPVTEATALPEGVKNLLGADDPKTARLRVYASSTGTVAGLLPVLKISAEAAGVAEGDVALTEATVSTLVKKLKFPVVQYDLRADPPQIIGNQLMQDLGRGYAVFVVSPDGKPSLVVTNPLEPVPLKKTELPANLIKLVVSLKKLFSATSQ